MDRNRACSGEDQIARKDITVDIKVDDRRVERVVKLGAWDGGGDDKGRVVRGDGVQLKTTTIVLGHCDSGWDAAATSVQGVPCEPGVQITLVGMSEARLGDVERVEELAVDDVLVGEAKVGRHVAGVGAAIVKVGGGGPGVVVLLDVGEDGLLVGGGDNVGDICDDGDPKVCTVGAENKVVDSGVEETRGDIVTLEKGAS